MAESPYPASKVSTLDRLINLDYVNQYEKILRPLPLGPRGLRSFDADLPVMDSAIATITEDGPVYRGVNCVDLAEKDTLEHTATLLWDVTAIDPFASDNCPHVSDEMRAIAEAARRAAPIDRAIATLALAASADPGAFTRAPDGRAL